MKKRLLILLMAALVVLAFVPVMSSALSSWTATIKYDLNGGTYSGGTIPDTTGTTSAMISTKLKICSASSSELTKVGYTFKGWKVGIITYNPGEDCTVYRTTPTVEAKAQWSANQYTITLDANGGTMKSVYGGKTTYSYGVYYGYDYGIPVSTLDVGTYSSSSAEREGWTFVGWYTEKEGGTQVTGDTDMNTAQNHTLYAHWEHLGYTVKFNGNGADGGAMSDQWIYRNDDTSLSKNQFTRTGYNFQGWAVSSNGIKLYDDEESVKNLVEAEGTIELYAKWKGKTYDINLDANGGKFVDGETAKSIEVSVGSTFGNDGLGVYKAGMYRTGYSFKGWYTDATAESGDGIYEVTNDTTVTATPPTTLYAHWTPNTYTVKLSPGLYGSGSEVTLGTFAYDVEFALPDYSTKYTRAGYDFDGWTTLLGTEYAVGKVNNLSAINGAEVTLYPKWKAKTDTKYTVKYYLQNVDGTYSTDPSYTMECTGTTDTKTEAPDLTSDMLSSFNPDYFTKHGFENINIDGDGSTVVKIIYDRKLGKAIYKNAESGDSVHYGATITLDLNDSTEKPATYTHGEQAGGIYNPDTRAIIVNCESLTISDPVRPGYTFTGWTKNPILVIGDFTLTAGWEGNSWTVDPDIKDVTYGTAISPFGESKYGNDTVTITYEGTGDTDYGSTTTAPTDAGTYKATFSVVETDTYGGLEKTVNFTINQKEAGLQWSTLSEADLVYSKTAKALTATATDLKSGDSCDVTVEVTTGKDNINVGTFTFTATGLSNSNYKLPTNVTSPEFTITQKEVTVASGITAKNRSYVSGDKTVELNVSDSFIDGKIEGDDLLPVATGEMADDNAGEGKTVAITITGLTGSSAGNYKLSQEGHQADTTVTISNASQNAPDVSKTDESIKGKADGKITGVDSTMEYRKSSDEEYTEIEGTEIENLAAGEYLVRYKAKDNYDASPDASLTIGYTKTITVTFDSLGGTEVESVTGLEWESVVAKPETDPTRDNSTFTGWSLNGKAYDFETKLTDDITLEAQWILDETDEGQEITISTDGETSAKIQVMGDEGVKASGLESIAKSIKSENTDKNVKVVLNVEVTERNKENKTETDAILEESTNKSALYFDIDLVKYVGDSEGENITDTGTNVIELIIPFDTSLKDNFEVYSYHEGEVIKYTEAKTGEDGTFYIEDNVIHIFTTKFSTFAVTYNQLRGNYNVRAGGTLTFNNSDLSQLKANKGTVIDLTKYVPSKEGYVFAGWYSDEALTLPVTEIVMKSNAAVYAKWLEVTDNEGCSLDSDCPAYRFADLDLDLWYHEGIHYCVENGLMQGVSENSFEPDQATTRAMIVTILWRMAGSPGAETASNFADVPSGEWYAKAVGWAQSTGVVTGYSDESFGPLDKITREQMAAILYRYAAYKGYDVNAGENLAAYTDAGTISSWAEDAMSWAVGSSLIKGRTASQLAPAGNATRAEVATIIYRFSNMLG